MDSWMNNCFHNKCNVTQSKRQDERVNYQALHHDHVHHMPALYSYATNVDFSL
jgi:hypothetical protein